MASTPSTAAAGTPRASRAAASFASGEPLRDLAGRAVDRRVGHDGHDHAGRPVEGPRVVLLEDGAAAGVGPRLEDRDEAPVGVAGAQACDGGADRRGVVGEVVDHGDAALLAAKLLAALDAAVAREGGGAFGDGNAEGRHRRQRSQGVLDVEVAEERDRHAGLPALPFRSTSKLVPSGPAAMDRGAPGGCAVLPQAVAHDRTGRVRRRRLARPRGRRRPRWFRRGACRSRPSERRPSRARGRGRCRRGRTRRT